MFSFFKKKEADVKADDIVWMSEEKKLEALIKLGKANPETIFIAWFDESYDKLNRLFTENGLSAEQIFFAQQVSLHHLRTSPVVFIEHYPLREKEYSLYEKLGLKKISVFTALDEPLMKLFGSEKIIGLMKTLGATEEESFQHKMISSSIKNAQEKLKQKLSFEHSARSQQDWLKQNVAS